MSRLLRSQLGRRLLSTEPTSKELSERAVLLGQHIKKTSKNYKLDTEEEDDLKVLDESIRKAEYLSRGFRDCTKFNQLPKNYAKNQHINSQDIGDYRSILWKFDAPIRYAFAYGSGVFSQGYQYEDTQVDLMFAVTYPEHWHSINMRYNSDHYSTLKYFGSGVVSKFQEIGAGVYFNPYVEMDDGRLIKYGVVSVDRLVKDLANWDSFYLAGRLQKPVKILRDDTMIRFWNQQNLKAAATLAYLNLPLDEPFNEFEFYKQITSLSYKGDVRYTLGAENPNKINNIVEKNFEYFQQYYHPIMSEVILQEKFLFPPGFNKENAMSKLSDINFKSSVSQMLKGVFTAGVNKSIKYAVAKRLKAK